MSKAGYILIKIVFIIESIFIIPLLWTIPSFVAMSKIKKGIATKNDRILVAVLGIIFGGFLGILGGIFILVELKETEGTKKTY